MKKIDHSIVGKILDLIVENDLLISEAALEKDFIVTDVLRAISEIRNDQLDLVFCGGTCLSKAYGLLDRISEDVDIKVVSKPGIVLSNNQRRNAISQLKKQIISTLVGVGFSESEINTTALDGNTYVVFNAEYATHFTFNSTLRPHLKLELNSTHLSHPSVNLDIGLLIRKLSNESDPDVFSMPCVHMQEALVEKMVSFPRRLAMHLSNPSKYKFDNALVRHIFDIYQIAKTHQNFTNNAELQPLILKVLDKDAKDFAHQYPKFLASPINEIKNAIKVAESNSEYKVMYDNFVDVMVYGKDSPSFSEAINCFKDILVPALPPENTNFLQYAKKNEPSP